MAFLLKPAVSPGITVLLPTGEARDGLLAHLQQRDIRAVFHYVPLHSSPMGRQLTGNHTQLPVTDDLAARLVRLPMYYEITEEEQGDVAEAVSRFVANQTLVR